MLSIGSLTKLQISTIVLQANSAAPDIMHVLVAGAHLWTVMRSSRLRYSTYAPEIKERAHGQRDYWLYAPQEKSSTLNASLHLSKLLKRPVSGPFRTFFASFSERSVNGAWIIHYFRQKRRMLTLMQILKWFEVRSSLRSRKWSAFLNALRFILSYTIFCAKKDSPKDLFTFLGTSFECWSWSEQSSRIC